MVEIETVDGLDEYDIIDTIAEERGHVGAPRGAFTVETYIDRVIARGGEELSNSSALRALRDEMEEGKLRGKKMAYGGNYRWVFWPANGQQEGAIGGR
jgi:hypothetical protein